MAAVDAAWADGPERRDLTASVRAALLLQDPDAVVAAIAAAADRYVMAAMRRLAIVTGGDGT